jgi:hypothetical protein
VPDGRGVSIGRTSIVKLYRVRVREFAVLDVQVQALVGDRRNPGRSRQIQVPQENPKGCHIPVSAGAVAEGIYTLADSAVRWRERRPRAESIDFRINWTISRGQQSVRDQRSGNLCRTHTRSCQVSSAPGVQENVLILSSLADPSEDKLTKYHWELSTLRPFRLIFLLWYSYYPNIPIDRASRIVLDLHRRAVCFVAVAKVHVELWISIADDAVQVGANEVGHAGWVRRARLRCLVVAVAGLVRGLVFAERTRMIWLLQALSDAHAVRSCRRVQMNLLGDLQTSNADVQITFERRVV